MINASLAAASVASLRSVSLDSNPPAQSLERSQRYDQMIEHFMNECSSADLMPILERAALFGRTTDPMEAFPRYLTREVRAVQEEGRRGDLHGVMIFQDSEQGRCWFFSPNGFDAYSSGHAFSEDQPWQLEIVAAVPGNPFERLLDIPVRQPRGAVFVVRDYSNLDGIEQQGWGAMLELMQTAQEIAGDAINVLRDHRDNRAQALELLSQSTACSSAIEHHRLELEQLVMLVREDYPQRFAALDEAKHEQLASIDASNDIDYRFEVEWLRRTTDKQEVELVLAIVAERFDREVTHL
ncbi:hypothetical protein ABE525_12715 [Pseudomonas wadenswilerensis]|jgi:hypothetical protein|uniref:hypothetical protein n=1 Tax=Pseudomonas TaxID=286 RepID=UPI001F18FD21|nr:hypothetical protein [Pseudomonas sp. LF19]MCE5984329.1 hypothetical protein [Pseudomonas sp. LF19]